MTTTAQLISFEMPTSMVGLTADPPEDITILRMVGSFSLSLATATTGRWTTAVVVQDTTWTPGATVSIDNDKRILWQRQWQPNAATGWTGEVWCPPDTHYTLATAQNFQYSMAMHIDIAPKAKLEAGKSLYLVAYEDVDGSALTTSSQSMRVLFQRSRRR